MIFFIRKISVGNVLIVLSAQIKYRALLSPLCFNFLLENYMLPSSMALGIQLQGCFRPNRRWGLFSSENTLVVTDWRIHVHNRTNRDGDIVRLREIVTVGVNSKRRKDEDITTSGNHRPEMIRYNFVFTRLQVFGLG